MKRRDFLKYTAPATVLPTFINGFAVKAFGSSPLLDALKGAADNNDHVLVMIQLTGGNDGLNMVVPLDIYAKYQAARPNIAINEGKVLPLVNTVKTGIHPAMSGVQEMYNDGKVCLIQSVGYPSPNYSHFRDHQQQQFLLWHLSSISSHDDCHYQTHKLNDLDRRRCNKEN